jgi:flagellar hook-basal body complex protein FliE
VSLTPISLAGMTLTPLQGDTMAPSTGGAPFASFIDRLLASASQSRQQSEQAIHDLALGRTDSMHEVMLQVAQADLSFRMILEVRNKLIEAYQEIMKMQI